MTTVRWQQWEGHYTSSLTCLSSQLLITGQASRSFTHTLRRDARFLPFCCLICTAQAAQLSTCIWNFLVQHWQAVALSVTFYQLSGMSGHKVVVSRRNEDKKLSCRKQVALRNTIPSTNIYHFMRMSDLKIVKIVKITFFNVTRGHFVIALFDRAHTTSYQWSIFTARCYA